MNAKISFIVPCYNVSSSIEKCLVSILKQKLNNFEIICVNDGSTDNTLQILNNFKKNNSNHNIIIHDQENKGVAYSRNKGVKLCKGKYISFIDSDDFYINNKNFFTNAIKKMEKQNDIDFYLFKSFFYIKKLKLFLPLLTSNSHWNCKNVIDYMKNNVFGFCWKGILRKEIIEKNKILFPEYKIVEDLFFMINYLLKCRKIFFSNKYVYAYVLHNKNTSIGFNNLMGYEVNNIFLEFLEKILEYLIKFYPGDINAPDFIIVVKNIFWFNSLFFTGFEDSNILAERLKIVFESSDGKNLLKKTGLINIFSKIPKPNTVWQIVVFLWLKKAGIDKKIKQLNYNKK